VRPRNGIRPVAHPALTRHKLPMRSTLHAVSLNDPTLIVRCAAGLCVAVVVAALSPFGFAAEFSARDVTTQLFKLEAGATPDFSKRDLAELDLSGVDFKSANLTGARMFGADLSRTNLSNADLSGANLDRANIIGARLDGANLSGVSMLRPTTTALFEEVTHDAPSFKGAKLAGTRIFGRFRNVDFSGADMTKSNFAPTNTTGFIENLWRADLMSANLSSAILENADFTYVMLRFADLRGANLRGAILKRVDMAHADFSGADLTGADMSNADLDGAKFVGAKGLETVKGLGSAFNVPAEFRAVN
jgi:uncharacterized protein YjbI with pentapeptide repeats